jgi:hypothetical protein
MLQHESSEVRIPSNKDNHSPRVHDPNHGGEVDIWGVRLCLKELGSSGNRVHNASAVKQMGVQWQEDETLTGVEALDMIKVLNCSCKSAILMFNTLQRAKHLFTGPEDTTMGSVCLRLQVARSFPSYNLNLTSHL